MTDTEPRTNDPDITQQLAEQARNALEWGSEPFRCVRIQSAGRDPHDLLNPTNWRSEPVLTDRLRETDGTTLGVSACVDEAALAKYFSLLDKIDEGCVVVVMEAIESTQQDIDTDQGAVLVWPQRIVSVTPLADTAVPALVEFATLEQELRGLPSVERGAEIAARQDQIIDDLLARYGPDQVNGWLGPVA